MQCPFCGDRDGRVVDSRSSEGGRVVRRRRQCGSCGRRFTTYERPEEGPIRVTVIKRDGSRQPYSRDKIIAGLKRACYKRRVSEEQIRRIVEHTEEEIFRQCDKEVASSFIGDVVSAALREVDKIAYVRFASVYRDFRDLAELIETARQAEQSPAVGPEQKDLFETQ
ncbi:MAG: transcriptional regulator NrdR [Phycisphaerae bacterium]